MFFPENPNYFFLDSPTGIVYCILNRATVENVAGEEDPFLFGDRVVHGEDGEVKATRGRPPSVRPDPLPD